MPEEVIRPWKIFTTLIILSICGALYSTFLFASPSVEGIQIYQKNLHLSPVHMQKLADDISRYRNADNIWDVLREEFTLPHYEDNQVVQEKIEWFMNNQDYLLRSASRAAPYLYYILQQVKKRHLPAEIVLLPIIESGYNPFSLSNVGAAGIWQLMPGTATGLGIKQDTWYDGRRDVIASTRGALNYLSYLQSFFEGNWLLAIAAYNTGEGNVLSAIKRNIRDGRDTDFWTLPLAQQTKDYVPSILALAIIISHPEQYPIYFPPVRNAPYLAQVDVGKQINLKYASTLAGISYQKLLQLNPGFSRASTSKKGPKKLVLPIENVEQFSENFSRSPLNTKIKWIHYRVKAGDTLASIAKKFNSSANAIHKMNHLAKNSLRRGMNLLIPNKDHATTKVELIAESTTRQQQKRKIIKPTLINANKNHLSELELALNDLEKAASTYTLQPGDTVYIVRSKDTLEDIAKRFHVNAQTLLAANQLSNGKLKSGQQLIVPTHTIVQTNSNGLQPGDTIYMVRRGDTIEKIALKFRTTPAAIRLANLIDDSSLLEGEKLVVPTHLRS